MKGKLTLTDFKRFNRKNWILLQVFRVHRKNSNMPCKALAHIHKSCYGEIRLFFELFVYDFDIFGKLREGATILTKGRKEHTMEGKLILTDFRRFNRKIWILL
jgi:hypothetical protein